MSHPERKTAITIFIMMILVGSLFILETQWTERKAGQCHIDCRGGCTGSSHCEFRDNANPVSNFTLSSETAMTFEDITFDASSSYDPNGDVAEYWYDFGDGSEGDEKWIKTPVASHSYSDNGIYTIRLKVRDTTDAVSDWSKRTVTILNRGPVANLTANDTSVLTGESVLLDGKKSSDPDGHVEWYRYRFGPGDLSEWSPLSTYELTFDMPGRYNITIDVRDDDNAVNRSGNFTIHVLNRPPTAALRVEGEVRKLPAGVSIMFTGEDSSDTDGDVVSYAWSFGDGGYGENVGVTHVFDETGIYVVELTVTDDAGGVDREELEVRVVKNLNEGSNGDEGGAEGPLGLSSRVWFMLILAIIIVLIIVVAVILIKRPGKDDGNGEMEKALSGFYSGRTTDEEEEMRTRDQELIDSYAKTIPGSHEGEVVTGGSSSSEPDEDLSGIDVEENEDDPLQEEKELELSFKSPDHYKKKRGEKRKKKDKAPRSKPGKKKSKKVTSRDSKKGSSPAKAGKKLVLAELPKLDIKKPKKKKGGKEDQVEEDAESDSGGGKNIEGSTAGGRKRGGVGADEPDSKK